MPTVGKKTAAMLLAMMGGTIVIASAASRNAARVNPWLSPGKEPVVRPSSPAALRYPGEATPMTPYGERLVLGHRTRQL